MSMKQRHTVTATTKIGLIIIRTSTQHGHMDMVSIWQTKTWRFFQWHALVKLVDSDPQYPYGHET